MGLGPVAATATALEKAGLTLADLDLIELNEAFAAQTLACTRLMGLTADDHERINVNGSGISLGHPVGATGARILATLAHELRRREAAGAWRPCASAAARASPRSSPAPDLPLPVIPGPSHCISYLVLDRSRCRLAP